MKYEIIVTDYTLDENGIVIDRDGGTLYYNDADDFIEMWNYFKGKGPSKKITEEVTENGKYLIMQPTEIAPYVTDYQVWGESYELIKEWEAKERERYTENNNEELPF
jgi:hypothetical protein